MLAVAAGTVAVLAALAVGDWLRPPGDRTHLGRFVQTVLDGGGADVVTRKIEQNLGIVTSSPVQLVLPLVAVAVAVVLAGPAAGDSNGWPSPTNARRRCVPGWPLSPCCSSRVSL